MSTKKVYELKDQTVGFFDPETKAKVVKDGTLEIDSKERTGKLTLAAIRAGGLIEVDTKAAEGKAASAKGKGKTKAE